jgi:hypothetical protein
MTENEMFEISFQRPSNYFNLSFKTQWDIDAALGILDWQGDNFTSAQKKRFHKHYGEGVEE